LGRDGLGVTRSVLLATFLVVERLSPPCCEGCCAVLAGRSGSRSRQGPTIAGASSPVVLPIGPRIGMATTRQVGSSVEHGPSRPLIINQP